MMLEITPSSEQTSVELDCPLPDKPSELLRVAIRDLKACAADPKYKIDMGVWHRAARDYRGDDYCSVCLAGAVLAQSCSVPLSTTAAPESSLSRALALRPRVRRTKSLEGKTVYEPVTEYKSGAAVDDKMMALDAFRQGYIDYGLGKLDIPRPDDMPERVAVRGYRGYVREAELVGGQGDDPFVLSRLGSEATLDEFLEDMEKVATVLENGGL